MTDAVGLVRHARTAWTGRRWVGRRDLPLSRAGRREAVSLAAALAPVLPVEARILASPAARARDTAAAIARAIGAPVELVAGLREVDVGQAEGLAWRDLERGVPDLATRILAGEGVDWPGGESRAEVAARALGLRVDIEASPRPVVAVGHAGILAALAAAFLGPGGPPVGLAPAGWIALRRDGLEWQSSEAA